MTETPEGIAQAQAAQNAGQSANAGYLAKAEARLGSEGDLGGSEHDGSLDPEDIAEPSIGNSPPPQPAVSPPSTSDPNSVYPQGYQGTGTTQ